MPGFLEDCVDVLGALTHPFAQQLSTVDDLEWFANFIADGLGCHGFSSAWWAMQEDCQTLVVALRKAPLTKQHSSVH